METLTFISAVLGVLAAIINRKRIIVIQHQSYGYGDSSGPSLSKRLKRCLLAFLGAIMMPGLEVLTGAELRDVLLWPFGILLLVAAYQGIAMLIVLFARLWR